MGKLKECAKSIANGKADERLIGALELLRWKNWHSVSNRVAVNWWWPNVLRISRRRGARHRKELK
jgi:hypothetical protein